MSFNTIAFAANEFLAGGIGSDDTPMPASIGGTVGTTDGHTLARTLIAAGVTGIDPANGKQENVNLYLSFLASRYNTAGAADLDTWLAAH